MKIEVKHAWSIGDTHAETTISVDLVPATVFDAEDVGGYAATLKLIAESKCGQEPPKVNVCVDGNESAAKTVINLANASMDRFSPI